MSCGVSSIFSTHDIHLAVELADLIFIIGFERDEKGSRLPGGTVIKIYDLKDLGLAWTDYSNAHHELAVEIENFIKTA